MAILSIYSAIKTPIPDNLVKSGIGAENVKLTDELRQKSVEVFLALSWACLEGSK